LQKGLQGCEVKIACRVARTGLGRTLLAAVENNVDGAVKEFLVGWRKELRSKLRNDLDGMIVRRYPSLAHRINESFPSLDVLKLYVQPVTSSSLGRVLDSSTWIIRHPDLGEMAKLCETLFGWASEEVLQTKFSDLVWPGAIFRSLLQVIYHLFSPRLGTNTLSTRLRTSQQQWQCMSTMG
jgi:Holliday junction resolvase YEN1